MPSCEAAGGAAGAQDGPGPDGPGLPSPELPDVLLSADLAECRGRYAAGHLPECPGG